MCDVDLMMVLAALTIMDCVLVVSLCDGKYYHTATICVYIQQNFEGEPTHLSD